jgi:nitrate/TMAO reductase-like tetraheme cytochrome c subunit
LKIYLYKIIYLIIKYIIKMDLDKINNLEKKMDQILKLLNKNMTIKDTKPKVERKPSAFNQFMKKELLKLKIDKPDLDHKSRFKLASEMWATSTENPKNKS